MKPFLQFIEIEDHFDDEEQLHSMQKDFDNNQQPRFDSAVQVKRSNLYLESQEDTIRQLVCQNFILLFKQSSQSPEQINKVQQINKARVSFGVQNSLSLHPQKLSFNSNNNSLENSINDTASFPNAKFKKQQYNERKRNEQLEYFLNILSIQLNSQQQEITTLQVQCENHKNNTRKYKEHTQELLQILEETHKQMMFLTKENLELKKRPNSFSTNESEHRISTFLTTESDYQSKNKENFPTKSIKRKY